MSSDKSCRDLQVHQQRSATCERCRDGIETRTLFVFKSGWLSVRSSAGVIPSGRGSWRRRSETTTSLPRANAVRVRISQSPLSPSHALAGGLLV